MPNRWPRSALERRGLGQHQLVAAQDVVDVDALDRQHVDVRNVARRQNEILVELGTVDDQRIAPLELGEVARALRSCRWPRRLSRIDDLARLRLGRERMTQSERTDLLGHVDGVAARLGPNALPPPRHCGALLAVTGAAGALLLVPSSCL